MVFHVSIQSMHQSNKSIDNYNKNLIIFFRFDTSFEYPAYIIWQKYLYIKIYNRGINILANSFIDAISNIVALDR